MRDACALLLLAAASAAWAAPDAAPDAAPAAAAPASAPDPVFQLLQSKGLLPAGGAGDAQAFARQVRDKASDLVLSAMNFIGVPYRWGGESASEGFDCSGFTRHVFEMSLGLVLPRRANEQARDKELIKVGRNELRPGDLVFFNTMRRAFSHVGIYVGDGKFIHAPRRGSEVRIDDLHSAYWLKRFNGARRAVQEAVGATATRLTEAAPASP